jgi:dolichol-phosphate mannosyltransferase
MATNPDKVVMDNSKTLVIIPTYNEKENIEKIISRLKLVIPEIHILVADDNSPDGTGDIADTLASSDSTISVLHRKGKEGLGAAYLAGFDWALSRGYEVIVEMDADGSHQPEYLPTILSNLEKADVSLGSRWVEGGRVVNWPKSRELLSRGGNLYVGLILNLGIRDATGGYRAYKRDSLINMNLSEVKSSGYCFQVDLVRRAVEKGLRVVETPIVFVERTHGVSKMSNKIVVEALWRVTVWGFEKRFRNIV